MNENTQNQNNQSQALEVAWHHYAELDANARAAQNKHVLLRGWVIKMVVIATLLAILVDGYAGYRAQIANEVKVRAQETEITEAEIRLKGIRGIIHGRLGNIVRHLLWVSLILVPIVGSTVLAFANKFKYGEQWLALRSGAEDIQKDIYLYRTILQVNERRHQWLSERVEAIQRQVYESFGGEMVLQAYDGKIPPYYDPEDEESDPGLSDLLADEYLRYRLESQLKWHTRKIATLQRARMNLQVTIFVLGGLGAFLGALGGTWPLFSVWVAFTAAFGAAINAWLDLQRHDTLVSNYSQLVLDLNLIRAHWLSLKPEERTGDEFFKLVNTTEQAFWSQHQNYISELRQAIANLQDKQEDMLNQTIEMAAPAALDEALLKEQQAKTDNATQTGNPKPIEAENLSERGHEQGATIPDMLTVDIQVENPKENVKPTAQTPESNPKVETDTKNPKPDIQKPESRTAAEIVKENMQPDTQNPRPNTNQSAPQAFVIMPLGKKQMQNSRWRDFDAIYEQLVYPASEACGFDVLRSDEDTASGEILANMFQNLLLADLVIADLSMESVSVAYKLGVRHAMRKSGLIHIRSDQSSASQGVLNVQIVSYHCDSNGKPEPKSLAKDKQALIRAIRENSDLHRDQIQSPIFRMLNGLTEQNPKSLRTPLVANYRREYETWKEYLAIAERQQRVGDILMLIEEMHNPIIREKAMEDVGLALRNLGCFELALKQYQNGLNINPQNIEFRRGEAFHLGQLKRYDEAIVKLEQLINDEPAYVDARTHLARIYIFIWEAEWNEIDDETERLKVAYETSHWLKKAINLVLDDYRIDPKHTYSGTTALTYATILEHLANQQSANNDPDVEAIRKQLPILKGAVRFSLNNAILDEANYSSLFSYGDLEIVTSDDPDMALQAYKKAIVRCKKNTYILKFMLSQLEQLNRLGYRPSHVEPSIALFKRELGKLQPASEIAKVENPPQVFLFSGHMIDAIARPEPRFPPEMESEAAQRIEKTLEELKAGSNDIAITAGAACGGDILFIETCLKRDIKVEVLLPFSEIQFIKESVSFAGDNWIERFYRVCNHPNVTVYLQAERLGPLKGGSNPFERSNLWALFSAMAYSYNRTNLIVLWDGKGGDGRGGTAHMIQEMRRIGGLITHLDTTQFDYWSSPKEGREEAPNNS